MKKLAVFLTFVTLGMVLATIARAETIRGEGRYMERTLEQLPSFNAIDIRGDVHMDIWQRPKASVSLSGKQNLVALADVRVENNTLIVDFARPIHIKGSHALHVTVAATQLTALSVRGNGQARLRGGLEAETFTITATDTAEIDGDSIKTNTLRLQATHKADIDLERLHANNLEAAAFNKAKIELSGYTEKGHLTDNGSGDIEADNLRLNHAQAVVNGSGDIELFAMHTLKAHANGSGKIIYHGQPTLTRGGNMKKIQPAFDD